MRKSNKMKQIVIALLITMFLPSTLLIAQKGDENDKANEYLTKLLGIWEDADADYIYYQEAKTLWKELNMEKAAVA